MKKLTKRQKEIETSRQVKNFIKEKLTPKLIGDIKNALDSENLPEDWLYKDNFLLSKFVLDNFCLDRPFKPMSENEKNEFENLKNSIKNDN